jgi:hypothetical protein
MLSNAVAHTLVEHLSLLFACRGDLPLERLSLCVVVDYFYDDDDGWVGWAW